MLLLSTSSLTGYWLHKIFHIAKKSQYDGIDLVVDFHQFDTYNSEYIKTLIDTTGIPVISITAPERKLTKKQLEEILGLADELGVETINFYPPHRLDKEKDWFGDSLSWIQGKYPKIIINIVNAPPKTWLFLISAYGDARPETIKKITEHTALSINNVDPSSGVDLMKTLILLGNTMNFVFLSDKSEEKDGMFLWEGNMPLESLLIKLSEVQFDGNFSLSVSPESIGAWDDELVLKYLENAKKYLYKYFS